MVAIPGLYFVIANGELARFVRPDPENGLHTIEVANFTTVRKRDVRAAPDPVFESASPDPRDLDQRRGQRRFARLLAVRINEDFAVDLFSRLVLVAPPPVLDELMAVTNASTRSSLFGSLAKDLVAVPDLELWPHLFPWVPPTRVTWAPTSPLGRW
jgi:protein required for attachment to host cells